MQIVHLILTRHFAGSERYAAELANLQARAGHQVSVILTHKGAADRPDAVAYHLDPAVRIGVVSNLKPLAWWQCRRLLRRWQPEVTHAHLSLGCRVLKKLPAAGLRVASLHIHYKPQQHGHLDGLIAVAPWQLADIPKALRQHSRQIDNWTLSQPAPLAARQRIRAALGVGNDTVLFGTLGRLAPSKGVDTVIRALQQANLQHAQLVIVGAGKAREELAELAGPGVHFAGYTESPQDWLAAMDVFVSGARSEPFGLVFLEAMQAGLPVLATESQGAQHLAPIMRPRLVPVDDVDAMAAAMSELGQHYPGRQQYDLTRFSGPARATEITEFYRALRQA